MSKTSLVFGLLLIALGVVFYFVTGTQYFTALIPAALGVIVVACGLVALKSSLRKPATLVGAMVGLLGAGAGFGMAIPKFLADEAGSAQLEQLLMGVLCAIYLWSSLRSFMAARRELRKARALVGTK